ncbi:hypothetical protein V5799_033732, partial [Amblyomma americanum]
MASVRLLNSSDLYSSPHHLNGSYHGTASNERSRTPKNGLEVIETSHAVRLQQEKPHLVSLGGGRLSTSVTIHPLPEGKTRIGRNDAPVPQDIVVQGPGVEAEHCYIQNESGKVTLHPMKNMISIDGMAVTEPSRLHQVMEPPSRFVGTPGVPTPGTFDVDNSVDFVEKVSKFEFLAHNRSPPVASSESPRWFVRDGIRVSASPPSRACEQAVAERLRDQEQERQERQRLEEILSLCAEYERKVQAAGPKEKKLQRSPPSSDSGTEDVTSPPGSGSESSSAPDDTSKTSESSSGSSGSVEDEKPGLQRNDTVIRRTKQLPECPDVVKPIPILAARPVPAPRTQSSLSEVAPKSPESKAPPPAPPPPPEDVIAAAAAVLSSGTSPPGLALVHHPNRIKTNGSLAPADSDGKRAGRLLVDGNILSDGMLTVAPKKVNVTSSEDELTNILGGG